MSKTQQALDNEGQVRKVIDNWFEALRNKDAAEILSFYADDATVFPPTGEHKLKGMTQLQPGMREWLDMFDGEITANARELNVVAGEDTAFAYMITNVSGKGRDGRDINMTTRSTVGFERRLGHWLAVHEHASFPVNMPEGTAKFTP